MNVKAENQRLKQRNIQLQLENSRLFEDRLENTRLRQLLDLKNDFPYANIPARVIALDGMLGVQSLVLNKGDKDGVGINMPVISTAGLVGKVIDLSAHHSVVQAVTDKNFSAAARVRDGRDTGIFKGTGTKVAELWGVPLKRILKWANRSSLPG